MVLGVIAPDSNGVANQTLPEDVLELIAKKVVQDSNNTNIDLTKLAAVTKLFHELARRDIEQYNKNVFVSHASAFMLDFAKTIQEGGFVIRYLKNGTWEDIDVAVLHESVSDDGNYNKRTVTISHINQVQSFQEEDLEATQSHTTEHFNTISEYIAKLMGTPKRCMIVNMTGKGFFWNLAHPHLKKIHPIIIDKYLELTNVPLDISQMTGPEKNTYRQYQTLISSWKGKKELYKTLNQTAWRRPSQDKELKDLQQLEYKIVKMTPIIDGYRQKYGNIPASASGGASRYTYKKRSYKIRMGVRGGQFIMVQGRKVYI
jgi:hypothetical protein